MDTLKAESRSMNVKARKLRREGYVIGNVFGRKIKNSIPVMMKTGEVNKLLKSNNKGSQIMLELDGSSRNVLIKEIDFNPLKGEIEHIDFQALVSDEMVHSVAEIVLLNHESIKEGILQVNLSEIAYKALPAALVDKVKIDVSQMRIGDEIKVKDLPLASRDDITITTDPDTVVVAVNANHNVSEEPDEESAE